MGFPAIQLRQTIHRAAVLSVQLTANGLPGKVGQNVAIPVALVMAQVTKQEQEIKQER